MDEWIDENDMPLEQAEEFFIQILDALEEALQIYHSQDLNPQ